MGRKYRSRTADNIVDEFEYICQNLPEVKEIFIEDDTFTVNKSLVLDVCRKIKERKLDITWSCNARATLDYSTLQEMKSAGCRLLIVGYESGNDRNARVWIKLPPTHDLGGYPGIDGVVKGIAVLQ